MEQMFKLFLCLQIAVSANENLVKENYEIFANNSNPIDIQQYITDIYDLIHSNFSGVIGSTQTSDQRASRSNVNNDFCEYDEKLVLRQQWNDISPRTQILKIMKQIIYTMRYRIKYVEALRVKYRVHDKYKVGFWISKVRNIRTRMTNVFSTAMNNKHWSFQAHILLYNKLVYINVDVASIVDRIANLHKKIQIAEKPKSGVGSGGGNSGPPGVHGPPSGARPGGNPENRPGGGRPGGNPDDRPGGRPGGNSNDRPGPGGIPRRKR